MGGVRSWEVTLSAPLPKDLQGADDNAPGGGAACRALGTLVSPPSWARHPPCAAGGFPRSAPRAPADRSGRFQPPPRGFCFRGDVAGRGGGEQLPRRERIRMTEKDQATENPEAFSQEEDCGGAGGRKGRVTTKRTGGFEKLKEWIGMRGT